MAPEAMITSWSRLATAGRRKALRRGWISSSDPEPSPLHGDGHPIPHQGALFLIAEFSPGPAGDQLPAALDVIEAAEGLAG